MNKKLTTSLVAGLLIATNLYSSESLDEITVSSALIKTTEKNAAYATEIYTKKDIENSKSKDIYDFLSAQTSVNISPDFGNTFAQKLDLRGYGISNGFQNVIVNVNGRRLNTIDLGAQLLSSVPLESIERIEIIKGSGSVQYGDGANAGVINIITNGKNDNYIKAYAGNNGVRSGTVSLGYSSDNFIISGLVDYNKNDGSRETTAGNKDSNYNRNKSINLIFFPTENLELSVSRSYTNINTKYGRSLSLAEYQANPNKSSGLTEQYLSSYVTSLGLKYDINSNYSFDFNFNDEDKLSRYSSGFTADYEYRSFNSKLNIKDDLYKISLGVDGFLGDSKGSSSVTSKDNKGAFISSDFYLNKDLKLSTGFRREFVEYNYNPNVGATLNDKIGLNAFDLGLNYSINDNNSIFANFNKSFQAPDINRFFTFGGTFNGFIEPAKVNNYTLGYNNIQKNNKLKVSVFRADLKNEIYYESVSFKNTNIDKSHKYGIEIFNKYLINKDLFTSVNYSYIIAKIDEENEGAGAFDGKDLPGVSKHNVTVNLGYEFNKIKGLVSHTYRSSAYSANDFKNNLTQKQDAYNSTDLTFSYNYKNIEVFGKVQNLFDEANGLWVRDDAIYPVNFERTYYVGTKIKF